MVSNNRDVQSLTAEQLKHTPKIVLLQECIDQLWNRLSEHIRANSEIQQYHRCLKHYNLLCHQTHIDGPTPLIKNYINVKLVKLCDKCSSFRIAYFRVSVLWSENAFRKTISQRRPRYQSIRRNVSRTRYSLFA